MIRLLAASVVVLACSVAGAPSVPYPIEATWMQNRWTLSEWLTALRDFKSIGGKTVWQRGVPLVQRDEWFFKTDPDWAWCIYNEHCIERAKKEAESRGLVVVDYYTYSNDEYYPEDVILRCPGLDIKIIASRYHYRLIVPHGSWSGKSWNCSYKPGDKVDIIMTIWNALDPHRLLIEAAEQLDMEVYLPQPSVPPNPNPIYNAAFYEFTDRVMKGYEKLYGRYKSYKGIYQNNECWLGGWGLEDYVAGYKACAEMTHAQGRLFATSPYSVMPKCMVKTSVQDHKDGFKAIARIGSDIIAVQDGRGSGFCNFHWQFQENFTMESVDPVLAKVVAYHTGQPLQHLTFSEVYWASNQLLWRAFEEAVDELAKEEGIKTELWLNVEAFEFLRENPCLPIDEGGNGMAELLDRTTKSRVDWALAVDGARGAHTISFAWDADFLCTDGGYAMSLADEIRMDWDRPIVAYLDAPSGIVRGFNLASKDMVYRVKCQDGREGTDTAVEWDSEWGKGHSRSHLLHQVTLAEDSVVRKCSADKWVCVTAYNTRTGKFAYHEYCYEAGVRP